jgi:hypothetical protein
VHDLAGLRHPLDANELDPLDVTYDGELHGTAVSHLDAALRYST